MNPSLSSEYAAMTNANVGVRLDCLVLLVSDLREEMFIVYHYCDLTLSSGTKLSDFGRNDIILMVTKASRQVTKHIVLRTKQIC